MPHQRDYAPVFDRARAASWANGAAGRDAAMGGVCDLLWEAFGDSGDHTPGRGFSWVGFYLHGPGEEEMTLAVRRDKPACSPIGLHGMCGRCWLARAPILVADVATLGEGYIACDPKDRSELVVPCLDEDGACWGVLDADSWDLGAFNELDMHGTMELLRIAGLSRGCAKPLLRL